MFIDWVSFNLDLMDKYFQKLCIYSYNLIIPNLNFKESGLNIFSSGLFLT